MGGILEFGLHGTAMAPIVARVIERYLLGPDATRGAAGDIAPLALPEDSTAAPEAPYDSLRPIPPDSGRRPPPGPRGTLRPLTPSAAGRVGR